MLQNGYFGRRCVWHGFFRSLEQSGFGTLAVFLLTEHEGGQLRLELDNGARTVEIAPNYAHGMTSVAWYHDPAVKSEPVLSGYQLMVLSRLFDKSRRVVHSSSVYFAKKMKFEQLLRLWRDKIGTRN